MSNTLSDSAAGPPEHWQSLARRWRKLGCPLRPTAGDLVFYQKSVDAWCRKHGTPRVLLYGVTPQLYQLAWPEGRDFLAVDLTPAMIEWVWPGRSDEVLLADWVELPIPDSSRDIALCDGGLQMMDFPGSQQRFARRLHEVLAPDGIFILRLFTPAAPPESPEQVLADLLAGDIPDLNRLKIRLGTALQPHREQGVRLDTIWRRLRTLGDWEALARKIGWPLEELKVIDTYKDSPVIYHFTTASEACELLEAGGRFECVAIDCPEYDMGERCPVLTFRRR